MKSLVIKDTTLYYSITIIIASIIITIIINYDYYNCYYCYY
jgi:hypothetical protein